MICLDEPNTEQVTDANTSRYYEHQLS